MNEKKNGIIYHDRRKVFAYRTTVLPEKSISDIKKLIKKHGCKGWLEATHPVTNETVIQFQVPNTRGSYNTVQFNLKKVYLQNTRGIRYLENESYRLLFLIIKSKILVSQYTSFIAGFMSNLLLEDNRTLLEKIESGSINNLLEEVNE